MRIGFSTTNGIMSKAIRWFTHSKASHSYIIFLAEGQTLMVEADQHGVICEDYSNFKKKNKIVAEFELTVTPEEEHKIVGYALQQLTRPYNFLEILGYVWIIVNKTFGRTVKQPFKDRSAYVCSELVICSLQAGNFPLSHFMNRFVTPPEGIIEFLLNHLRAKLIVGNP